MRLVLTRTAQRDLAKITPKLRRALIERVEAIAEQPFAATATSSGLRGSGTRSGHAKATGEPSIGPTARRERCGC
jgi:hypothetical protein